MNEKAIVTTKITEDLILETKNAALSATGDEKISLMNKLRIFLAHRGKYIVQMQKESTE